MPRAHNSDIPVNPSRNDHRRRSDGRGANPAPPPLIRRQDSIEDLMEEHLKLMLIVIGMGILGLYQLFHPPNHKNDLNERAGVSITKRSSTVTRPANRTPVKQPADGSSSAYFVPTTQKRPASTPVIAVPAATRSHSRTPIKQLADGGSSAHSVPTTQKLPESAPVIAVSTVTSGKLFVQTYPWSRVELDGASIGNAPMREPLDVSVGKHTLRLIPVRSAPISREIEIRAGKLLSFQWSFK